MIRSRRHGASLFGRGRRAIAAVGAMVVFAPSAGLSVGLLGGCGPRAPIAAEAPARTPCPHRRPPRAPRPAKRYPVR